MKLWKNAQKKGPYDVPCKCGFVFIVSHAVIHRQLDCPSCGRVIWYERNLKGDKRAVFPVGRFKGKKELERRLYAKARANVQDRPAPKKDKEPSSLRGNKSAGVDKVNGQKAKDRPVLGKDSGLSRATGKAHGTSRKVKKARVAK
jgi:hypothetical protein